MTRTLLVFLILVTYGCKKELPLSKSSGYPEKINTIIQTNCAVTGCHNSTSKNAAAGLSLETWSDLINGGFSGSVVIPFRPDQSLIHLYTNTYPDLGLSLSPTMPLGGAPLPFDEMVALKSWIEKGAPSALGKVAFDEKNRSKFYVVNQGCDEVAVVDAATLLVSRYIKVGVTTAIEGPHAVKVSPDKRYVYIAFALGGVIQKIDCTLDKVIGTADIGFGMWNSMVVSPDGNTLIAADWQSNGRLAIVNTQTMALINTIGGLSNGHGLAASPDFQTLYCTIQPGNQLYRIDISDLQNPEVSFISLGPGSPDPHDIIFTPDGSKYFVTCQSINIIKVFQSVNDSLINELPTGLFPQEMAVAQQTPYLFVTCMNEPVSAPKSKGSVMVFDYETMELVNIFSEGFYQPHGIAVNDHQDVVLISNRNLESTGPAPHHTGECSGRHGFVRALNLGTLQMIGSYRHELSVDPYNIASR